ncbi:organelle RRM domain-containing protein 2, mitochondrial-like protein [Tanacetum coccineum]
MISSVTMDDLEFHPIILGSKFVDSKVVKDRASGLSKGFGFLQYYTPEGAATSIEAMDGKYVLLELRPNDDIPGGDGGRFTDVLRRRFLRQGFVYFQDVIGIVCLYRTQIFPKKRKVVTLSSF